jgi:hypothetical protein
MSTPIANTGESATAHIFAWFAVGHRRDVLAVLCLVLLALGYLSPALSSGLSFGPADLGRGLSVLTSAPHSLVHNNINGDIIDQSVAWNTLNYTLIHHGQFPLWNIYAGNGLPQFLNFESAVLALPSLFGYLVPLSISFTITIFVKLLIAGLGTYWCARLLRLGVASSTFAGATFMLSGAFANWLGWSISGVVCWAGFLFAGAILCYRATRLTVPVTVFGLSIAFAIYGGFPEGYVLLAGTFMLLFLLIGVGLQISGHGVRVRSLVAFGGGGAIGLGLSSPLWLPGIGLIRSSIRAGTDAAAGIPIHGILLALAQGYDGLPTQGSAFFLASTNYFESAAYLGIIGLVLAGVAVGSMTLKRGRREPVVIALTITAVVQLFVIYQFGSHDPVQHLIRVVGLGSIGTHRLLPVLAFVVALLGAYGFEQLVHVSHAQLDDRSRVKLVDRSLLASVIIIGAVLGYMWTTVGHVVSTSCVLPAPGAGLSVSTCEAIRRSSLYGPSIIWLLFAAVCLRALFMRRQSDTAHLLGDHHRSTPALLALLLAVQCGALLFAGVSINTYSKTNYPVTTAVSQLASISAGKLVAQDGGNATCPVPVTGPCGVRAPTGIDLYPNINIAYGIDELGMHDPIIPKDTFADWPVANAGQLIAGTNLFNPDVNSLALARDYGVSFVLVPSGTQAPVGMTKVTALVNNGVTIDLFHVPDSAKVTTRSGARVTKITTKGDQRVVVSLRGTGATTLVAHITDVAGWHASVNGTNVKLSRGPTNDLVIHLPAQTLSSDHATLTLTYLPSDLLVGVVLALICILALLVLVVVERRGKGFVRKA